MLRKRQTVVEVCLNLTSICAASWFESRVVLEGGMKVD